jgi:hypothetical protein
MISAMPSWWFRGQSQKREAGETEAGRTILRPEKIKAIHKQKGSRNCHQMGNRAREKNKRPWPAKVTRRSTGCEYKPPMANTPFIIRKMPADCTQKF